ncbi:hypothetical protein KPH14_001993 [Odynerus spinipes]|uniref:G-protein coupled receptors family 2 profile 2 domain-containing protein n=1 Tax=Odynerus spinipes TaxID=1348599 RepID=A0AAD9S068_9HYME|nr:hypothetical protein KPH14_001993 [Odynerus spinipes]
MGGGRNRSLRVARNMWWCCVLFLLTIQISSTSSSRETKNPVGNSSVNSSTVSVVSIPDRVRSFDTRCPRENTGPFCIPLCCTWGYRMENSTCVKFNASSYFPPVYDAATFAPTDLNVDETNFRFFLSDPCNGSTKYKLTPQEYDDDHFLLLHNGSLYLSAIERIIEIRDYCFGVIDQDQYDVIMCFGEETSAQEKDSKNEIKMFFPIGLIISVPCLMVTFFVYTIIPELKNMHGRTLRGYVGSLVVAYLVLAILQTTSQENISDSLCIVVAFVIHFSFLASFFWLNIMCFDIWWTFGGFRALRGSVQQRDRKKFIMYSIYAWGSASVLTGVCLIMDFAPNIPKNFIRPRFGTESCWFNDNAARAIYFYGPMGITVFCNICLFISTAVKIQKHKRDTAHHLKGSESRRHDDNKQWFNLYLKLFIVMGINWSMEIVSWLCDGSPEYVWYITDLANTLQGLIIFIIFVCKDKIKRLLLKRFGCQDNNILSRNSTRSVYHSSASRTCTTSTGGVPLREKVNTHIRREPISSSKESAEESDCA